MRINDHSCVVQAAVIEGAYTASSRHIRGVNALFADGHVAFPADAIAPSLWHALGTRNGGEILSNY